MKDMLDRLVHLQETDEKIVAFQKEEEEIPREIQEKENSIGLLEEEQNQIQASLDDLEEQISALQLELEEVKENQRRCQARALAVKNQREYQAVQRESEIAKKRRGEVEAQIKEFMDERKVIEESSQRANHKEMMRPDRSNICQAFWVIEFRARIQACN